MRNSDNSMISVVNLMLMAVLVAGSHKSADADIIFGTTTNVGPNVNSSYNDGTPCISRDGLSLYFASTRPGGVGTHDLWVATRASMIDEWSEPVHLGATVNSGAQDYGPSISADELTLYFRSTRVGGRGEGDIWVSTRSSTDAPWPVAVNAGPGINTSSDECMPFISSDGLELYFGSRRGGGRGQDDLYVATRPTTSDPWSDPVNLGSAVNSGAVDACPSISPDGLTLFFNSTRSGGFGNYDLYVTTRPSTEEPWSAAVNLGETINTVDDEMTPSFWADGSVIYFSSWAEARPGSLGGADLWQARILNAARTPDLNSDGKVGMADFCRLAQYWMQDESSVDIAPRPFVDGRVDFRDLTVLSEYWLKDFRLIALWKLDETEGTKAYDSIRGNDGLLAGGVWQPTGGKVDGSLEFDGVYDLVSTFFVLNPVYGAFSVFAWIKGGAPGQVIISQANGTGIGQTWLGADTSNGRLTTTLTDGSDLTEPMVSKIIITDGQWHHIGIVWDGYRRHLYVDGEEVVKDTNVLDGLQAADGGLFFGIGKDYDATSCFSGLIDDVRIYNVALSAKEIEELAR